MGSCSSELSWGSSSFAFFIAIMKNEALEYLSILSKTIWQVLSCFSDFESFWLNLSWIYFI